MVRAARYALRPLSSVEKTIVADRVCVAEAVRPQFASTNAVQYNNLRADAAFLARIDSPTLSKSPTLRESYSAAPQLLGQPEQIIQIAL